MTMKRIGILGGTFNPIHNGHIAIAKKALEEYALEKIHIMPSGISYFKDGTGVLPSEIRGEMTYLAVKDIEGLYYDDREMKRSGNTYTCDTIREISEEYDNNTMIYYIIGADTLLNLHRWKDIEVLFNRCIILVALRDGESKASLKEQQDFLFQRYNACIEYLNISYIDISSSQIRELCQKGHSITEMVPGAVERYITEKDLYK